MKLINNLYAYPEQGMMDCNTYVLKGSPGIIFDAGNPDYLDNKVELLKRDGIGPKDIGLIVNTHLHIDHCGSNEAFKALSGAKIVLHPVQKHNYQLVLVDGTRELGGEPPEFTEDYVLEGDTLVSGGIKLEMIPAPGHSPDSVCYYDRANKAIFCGDVVFETNVGRTDFTGGSSELLKKSIESLSKLDIEYLLPGHMGPVIGKSKVQFNFDYVKNNVFPWL